MCQIHVLYLLIMMYVLCSSRRSPVPSPTGPRRRLFVSESTRTGDSERSTIVLTTPGFITHTICCPEVAGNVSTVITASGDKSRTPIQNDVYFRRSSSYESILKTPGQSLRWTHSQLFHTGKQHTTVVRFNPVVVVKFITENGIECFDHTQPITSDNKNTRRSHFRRQKSLPVVKLPSIS